MERVGKRKKTPVNRAVLKKVEGWKPKGWKSTRGWFLLHPVNACQVPLLRSLDKLETWDFSIYKSTDKIIFVRPLRNRGGGGVSRSGETRVSTPEICPSHLEATIDVGGTAHM